MLFNALWILFGISLLLLIYPFAIYPLILRLLPTASKEPTGTELPKTASLLICARNEAATLDRTLQDLRRVKGLWPALDIRVYDDASIDATNRKLGRARDILSVHGSATQCGKAAGLRALLTGCTSEILIFMDANTCIDPPSLLRLREHFANPGVGAVSARLTPVGSVTSGIGRLYWTLEETIKQQETRTGSMMGCDGALWAIRRDLYPRFGLAESDDFRPSMEPLLQGFRVMSAPDVVAQEEAIPDSAGFARTVRITCGAWHAHRAIWTRVRRMHPLDRFKYISHKLIRWFSGLWLCLAGLALLGIAVLSGTWLYLAAGLAAATVAGATGLFPLGSVMRVAAMFLATTLGVLQAMLGRSHITWAPVRT